MTPFVIFKGKMMGTFLKRRMAAVVLVNDTRRLLLQYRDASAPTSPNQWSLPGGGIEPDETAEEAARRELLEETGLQIEGPLAALWHGMLPSISQPGAHNEWYAFVAHTPAHQEDVILGEGQAMVFMLPHEVFTLDLSPSTTYILLLWLASPESLSP